MANLLEIYADVIHEGDCCLLCKFIEDETALL